MNRRGSPRSIDRREPSARTLLVLLPAIIGILRWTWRLIAAPRFGVDASARSSAAGADHDAIAQAFRTGRSDLWVRARGTVFKVLPDDLEPPPHMRMLVRLPNGHTVMIAHNISLAPRPPVREDTAIEFHGEYEWSGQGGTIHWTHHDPDGRRDGGRLIYDGRTYR